MEMAQYHSGYTKLILILIINQGKIFVVQLISSWLSKNCDKNSRMRKISYSKSPAKVRACADSRRNQLEIDCRLHRQEPNPNF